MDTFLSKLMNQSDYRKWLICKELDQRKEITVQHLLVVCECTSKTLFKDIEEINANYFMLTRMPLIKKKNSLIYIKYDQIVPLNIIYKKCVEQSQQFNLLNEVVENSELTLSEFSKRHYLSYNPVYSSIRKVNVHLLPFDLRVIKFKLVGEEYKIWIFLFYFYWALFGGGEWPFKKVNKNQCVEEVNELMKVFSSDFTWIEREKLTFLVAVIIMRERVMEETVVVSKLKYWKSLDKKGQQLIEINAKKLAFKSIKNSQLFLLMSLVFICNQTKINGADIDLSNFSDSLSRASNDLMIRLNMDSSEKKEDDIYEAQKEIIKFIHYSQLGEAYTLLDFNTLQEESNIINSVMMHPEMASFSADKSSKINQILAIKNLVKSPEYCIYIATKFGEVKMKQVKDTLESVSPNNYKYLSLWNTSEYVDVMLTDLEDLPERREGLRIQFMYPFTQKKASEIVARIKAYFEM